MALSSRASCSSPSFALGGRLVPRLQQGHGRALSGNMKCNAHNSVSRLSDSGSRRQLLLAAGLIAAAPHVSLPARADVEFTTYEDGIDGFDINIPTGWTFGSDSGTPGGRRTLAWYPQDAARETNVTVVVTPLSVEYTKMGSMGSVNTFASNLVNSMDRSYVLKAPEWARGKEPVQIAKLLDATEINGQYYLEYFVESPTEGKKHLYSLVSLGFNGRYNRLYTVTAQCPEADVEKCQPTLLAMVKSLVPPHLKA